MYFFRTFGLSQGVFAEEAVHRVEGSPSPYLHRPEAHLVHLFGNGKHIFCAHSRRIDRLVAIAECVVLNLNGIDRTILHNIYHFFSSLMHHHDAVLLI
jgi:hypothetical protein